MRRAVAAAARPGFRPEGDPNDRAIVALVRSGDFDLLLPADAESNVTAALPLPPRRGAEGRPPRQRRRRACRRCSSGCGPRVAAIEVGRGNTYGHPTPSTLAALRAVDHVFRTDRDGTVRLRVRGGAMRVERRSGRDGV